MKTALSHFRLPSSAYKTSTKGYYGYPVPPERKRGVYRHPARRPLVCSSRTCRAAQAIATAFDAPLSYVLRLARIIKAPRRSRNFSTWLLGELLDKGLSQAALAEQSGLEPEIIAAFSRGVIPTIEQIQVIAGPLSTPVSWLAEVAGLDILDLKPTRDEVELLEQYRRLSPPQRKLWRALLTAAGSLDPLKPSGGCWLTFAP